MNTLFRPLGLAAMCALASSGAMAASAKVTFVQPEKYMDIPYDRSDREFVFKDLSGHIIKQAARLPQNQHLQIDVLDLDLAGREVPSHRFIRDIRVLNGRADWPHMKLRYSLTQDGRTLASGQEDLSNMGYIDRMNRYSLTDPLRYEKQMLDDWFRDRFNLGARH